MKVLFICDWDYTYFWERVAQQLLDQGAAESCSALVVGKLYKEYLDKQKKQVFSSSCLLQDAIGAVGTGPVDWQRLRELEKRYAYPTLWRYVWADRWVHSDYEKICKRLTAIFDFYESFYEMQKPDLIVTAGYGSMPHLVGHAVARQNGIPMFCPIHTRIEDLHIPGYSVLEELDWIDDYLTGKIEPSQKSKEYTIQFLNRFRTRPVKPNYDSVSDHYYGFDIGSIYRYLRYMYRYWLSGSYANDHTKPNPLKKLWMEISPRIRRRLHMRAKFWDHYVTDVDYVYYPLHMQPETSTMAYAPYYLDQISVIANLAKSVPVNVRVVVKEHPFMVGRRDMNYYREIKKLPNVDLVPPFTDNFGIIKNARIVFTITGTAALEAAILGKPAIVLGPAVHRYCPSIVYAGDTAPTQWARLIKTQLESQRDNEDGLHRFLSAIFDRSFSCSLMEPNSAPDKVLANDNVKIVANVLHGEMDKIRKDFSYGRMPL